MQNRKKLTYDIHLNSKNAIDVAEGFRVLGLIRKNIFLDKAYELSTYLSKIY
jgi:hypothetical protein